MRRVTWQDIYGALLVVGIVTALMLAEAAINAIFPEVPYAG